MQTKSTESNEHWPSWKSVEDSFRGQHDRETISRSGSLSNGDQEGRGEGSAIWKNTREMSAELVETTKSPRRWTTTKADFKYKSTKKRRKTTKYYWTTSTTPLSWKQPSTAAPRKTTTKKYNLNPTWNHKSKGMIYAS